MTWWKKTALVLANIGAINWALAQFDWDLVEKLIGSWSPITATIVYYIIAVCGIYGLVKVFQD